MSRKLLLAAALIAVALGIAACDAIGGPGDGESTTSQVPPQETTSSTSEPQSTTTEVPDTTEAPGTTQPSTGVPDDGPSDDDTTPWWLLIVAGVALISLIVAFVSRGSNRATAAPPGRLTWKDHAQAGYAGARWAYDALTEDVAIWRGNAQYEGTTDVGTTAGTSMAETWQQLGPRIDSARDSLYALEAAAPDPRTAETARGTITTMLALRGAVDARAEARFAYRSAEAAAVESPTALIEARDREIRASTNFNAARSDFAAALNRLATVV